MKITKKTIRRLIRESIEDFAKADFVAGTEVDQTAIPRQIFDNIKAWMENPNNQKSIKKLKAFKEEIDTNPKTRYFGPDGKRSEALSQYDSLATGVTANTVPGGMKGEEIYRIKKRYIAFLGDQLVQQHPKLREYIASVRQKPGYQAREEIKQLDALFEPLFDLIDEVGVGPINYSDYVKAKEDLRFFDTGTPYYAGSRAGRHSGDPVTQGHFPSQLSLGAPIFDPHNLRTGPATRVDSTKDYAVTSKFNSQNTNITDGLGLYVIDARYDLNVYGDFDYDDYSYDPIEEEVRDEFYSAPGMITGIDMDASDEHGHKILRFYIIATNNELAAFENSHGYKVINIDGVNRYGGSENVTLTFEATQLIQPNSMDSIRKFLDPHGAGIPTHSNSAQGIRREHETFLQSVLDSANYMMGNHSFASDAEEASASEKLDLIYNILELKGYEIEGI